MTQPAKNTSLTLVRDLPHPPEKVWKALTDPGLLSRWLMANDMVPQIGQAFTFRAEPKPWWDGVVQCEILEVVDLQRISYRWQGGPEAARLNTVVTWTLLPLPSGGTRLQLDHTGFEPSNSFAYAGAEQGWTRNIQRLDVLLAASG